MFTTTDWSINFDTRNFISNQSRKLFVGACVFAEWNPIIMLCFVKLYQGIVVFWVEFTVLIVACSAWMCISLTDNNHVNMFKFKAELKYNRINSNNYWKKESLVIIRNDNNVTCIQEFLMWMFCKIEWRLFLSRNFKKPAKLHLEY